MGLFDQAFGSGDWLATQTRAADGDRTATYTRGATSETVSVLLGQVAYQSIAEGGVRVELGDRDYMIRVADMTTFGTPRIGDRITEAGVVYEVMTPDNGEPHWRYSGVDRTEYRIHVKRVA